MQPHDTHLVWSHTTQYVEGTTTTLHSPLSILTSTLCCPVSALHSLFSLCILHTPLSSPNVILHSILHSSNSTLHSTPLHTLQGSLRSSLCTLLSIQFHLPCHLLLYFPPSTTLSTLHATAQQTVTTVAKMATPRRPIPLIVHTLDTRRRHEGPEATTVDPHPVTGHTFGMRREPVGPKGTAVKRMATPNRPIPVTVDTFDMRQCATISRKASLRGFQSGRNTRGRFANADAMMLSLPARLHPGKRPSNPNFSLCMSGSSENLCFKCYSALLLKSYRSELISSTVVQSAAWRHRRRKRHIGASMVGPQKNLE